MQWTEWEFIVNTICMFYIFSLVFFSTKGSMARATVFGRIKLQDIFTICDCNASSRNYTEGENILDSDHVIFVGETPPDDEYTINIYGLVRKTSCLSSAPHEVKGTIVIEETANKGKDRINVRLRPEQFVCSCKAGAGEQCKHVVAVLLYLYRQV